MGIVASFVKYAALSFALAAIFAPMTGACAKSAKSTMAKPAETDGSTIKIVAFGDSLTAGYQLRPRYAFPAVLEKALKQKGHNVTVANAGVSGDTTAAGLARLDWAVPEGTDAVILELGANDALRGLDPRAARANLDKIVGALRSRQIEVLIAGVPAPSNFGHIYREVFATMFDRVANKYKTLLYPNFLSGIVMKPEYNLSDGMHPNPKGVFVIVANIMPKVETLIARVKARRMARSNK